MSEQQFAASLDAEAEKPPFEIDDVETEPSGVPPAPPPVVRLQEQESMQAGTGSPALETVASPFPEEVRPPSEPEADWRSLVSAKVNSYKARKPQKERYPSLKLQFDPPPQRPAREAEPMAYFEAQLERVEEPHAEAPREEIAVVTRLEPPRIVLEATARVLEFPRPAARPDALADPVIDRPRIVEAPELLPPPPAMGGILIEQQREREPERRPGFDVPLQSASLNRRVAAGLCDAALVALAVALFAYIFVRINGGMPPLRTLAVLAAGLFAIFWPAYQYALLVFSGRTPGLWAARLHLARFDGQAVPRRLRRWRVLASVLSFASLGLGYAWCFFDEDQLSWHDRITKTHLAP